MASRKEIPHYHKKSLQDEYIQQLLILFPRGGNELFIAF